MNVTELLRHQFELGHFQLSEMLKSMTQEELLTPPAPGGNFPLWIIGHLAYSEARGLHVRIRGESNPLEAWADKFGQGSTPAEGNKDYPSKDELWSRFEHGRRELLRCIDTLREDDLDTPTDFDHPFFNTVGKLLGTMAAHQFLHIGQIADTRKRLGKNPVLA